MSVALVSIGLRLDVGAHHHGVHHLHHHHHHRGRDEASESASLRFSVVNILRPDFGRAAILSTRSGPATPSPLPRDLSVGGTRLSPQSPPTTSFGSSHCGLSRSGSLESLASSRSSVAGSTGTGAASLCSAASTVGADSGSGESSSSSSTLPQNPRDQSLWPAWVYCTRYSDRPSSGEFIFLVGYCFQPRWCAFWEGFLLRSI